MVYPNGVLFDQRPTIISMLPVTVTGNIGNPDKCIRTIDGTYDPTPFASCHSVSAGSAYAIAGTCRGCAVAVLVIARGVLRPARARCAGPDYQWHGWCAVAMPRGIEQSGAHCMQRGGVRRH